MPINLLKYGLALISTAIILFFATRVAMRAMKKAGWIGKKKAPEAPVQKEELGFEKYP